MLFLNIYLDPLHCLIAEIHTRTRTGARAHTHLLFEYIFSKYTGWLQKVSHYQIIKKIALNRIKACQCQ